MLVTGHTGFKGGWLSLWLNEPGANVFGYSLKLTFDWFKFSLKNSDMRAFTISQIRAYQAHD